MLVAVNPNTLVRFCEAHSVLGVLTQFQMIPALFWSKVRALKHGQYTFVTFRCYLGATLVLHVWIVVLHGSMDVTESHVNCYDPGPLHSMMCLL